MTVFQIPINRRRMPTRSCLAVLTILASLTAAATIGSGQETDRNDGSEFVGTWHVTSATTSVLLIIQPDGRATFILIQKGSHGIDNVTWKPLAGGILVEGLPRFRFWKGRNRMEARVEMEPLPPELTDASMQEFPQTFFMRRVGQRTFSGPITKRELPAGWADGTLPTGWDEKAGRRREPSKK